MEYINIKSNTYYFIDDIINMKNFDPNNIKLNEKSYKHVIIYYIEYIKIKDSKYLKINSVNPLYLIFSKVNGHFEEISKSKYLTLVHRKKKLKNMIQCRVKSKM